MANKLFRWILTVATVLLILAGTVYIFQLRPAMLRSRQVRSLADMNAIARYLDDYQNVHKAYPTTLHEALPEKYIPSLLKDGFGGHYLYESRPDGFILVSFGSGRKPDGLDYWNLRNSSELVIRVAGEFSADQVISDKGWHREAGK